MTTKTTIEIQSTEYDGIITWSAKGQLDKGLFLTALLFQHADQLDTEVRSGKRLPILGDVHHFYGQPTECMDGFLTPHEVHDSICDPDDSFGECDFDPEKSFWLTMVVSESLYPETDIST